MITSRSRRWTGRDAAPHRFNQNKEVWFRTRRASKRTAQKSAAKLSLMNVIKTRAMALILDFLFVDFRTGFVDHDHASTLVAVVKVNGDLTGDQVGGFPGVVLVLAIQPNRIFEPDTVSDVEMKNGHWLLLEVNARKRSMFRDAVQLC
jgi:hypothetical protein